MVLMTACNAGRSSSNFATPVRVVTRQAISATRLAKPANRSRAGTRSAKITATIAALTRLAIAEDRLLPATTETRRLVTQASSCPSANRLESIMVVSEHFNENRIAAGERKTNSKVSNVSHRMGKNWLNVEDFTSAGRTAREASKRALPRVSDQALRPLPVQLLIQPQRCAPEEEGRDKTDHGGAIKHPAHALIACDGLDPV